MLLRVTSPLGPAGGAFCSQSAVCAFMNADTACMWHMHAHVCVCMCYARGGGLHLTCRILTALLHGCRWRTLARGSIEAAAAASAVIAASACACMCVHACAVHACAVRSRACMCVHACACMCVCVHVRVHVRCGHCVPYAYVLKHPPTQLCLLPRLLMIRVRIRGITTHVVPCDDLS